jgi:hypothetical protein
MKNREATTDGGSLQYVSSSVGTFEAARVERGIEGSFDGVGIDLLRTADERTAGGAGVCTFDGVDIVVLPYARGSLALDHGNSYIPIVLVHPSSHFGHDRCVVHLPPGPMRRVKRMSVSAFAVVRGDIAVHLRTIRE